MGLSVWKEVLQLDFPYRKSPRIAGYNYTAPNYYFVTICTHEKKCIFGTPGRLSPMGRCAGENLLTIPQVYPGVRIDKYVVMPNHIHAIIVIDGGAADLCTVIGQYKMSVTKRIRETAPGQMVWQRSFHDHVIRNQAGYEKIWLYIDGNPLKWEDDCFYVAEQ